MKKILILFLSIILFACDNNVKVILETDGKEYLIMDNVSFYYPKDFEIDLTGETAESVSFVDEDEIYKYVMIVDSTDNNLDDMPHLYLGQLEEDGAEGAEYSSIVLENEMECYEYTGIYSMSGIKFKQLVYFTQDATYIYMYQAAESVYDNNIDVVTQYLRSLTVHNEQVSWLNKKVLL